MNNQRLTDRRIALGHASRTTRGSNFGIVERIGLYVPGAGLLDR